jgi:hypothetical protein
MPTLYQPLKINGVITTEKTVLQNLNDICTACGAFLTFDVSQGKWAVIINKTETSVKSYNDSNIIGSIAVTESGVNELYNSVSLEFPHQSLRDQTDFIELSIPTEDRFPNEIDNPLQIQTNLINNPVQAQYIAGVELNQTRLNKVITFTTDYTSLGLKAGELISVTSTMYGYTNKLFRVIKLEELDQDVIGINITALEYDASVYNISNLIYKEKTKKTGILLKQQNETLRTLDDVSTGSQLTRLLLANAGAGLLRSLFSRLAGNVFGPENQAAADIDKILSSFKRPSLASVIVPSTVCAGDPISITARHSCADTCVLEVPAFEYDYSIVGIFEEDIASITINGAAVATALTGKIAIGNDSGSMIIDTLESAAGSTVSITIGGINDSVDVLEFDPRTFTTTSNVSSITEGGSVTFTVTTTGVANGTVIPYTISAPSGKVSSPSLTGNITINSNTASLAVSTVNDTVYTGTQSLTFTIDPPGLNEDTCHDTWDFSATVSILDTESPPPTPPPDVTRQYVLTPVVWEGVYDGTTGQMKSVFVSRSAFMPLPLAGESTVNVPLTLSVAVGSPSTITVLTTRAISTAVLGGTLLEPILTFNTVAPNTAITGTRAAVWGYY